MGIFHKLSTVIKSNINDLIARAENPEKMLNQIILDMRDQLARAKREVAAAIADERKLRSQLDDEATQARDWEKRAMLAVKEGRDDLAKQALMRHQEHVQRVQALDQTWRAQAQETEKLKSSLRQLNDKIEEAKRKRNLLIAKQKRAQAQRRIHETMRGLSDTSAFEAFDRMAERIEDTERRSLAAAEIDEALTGDTLEDEFKVLEAGGDDVEDRLLALKREMGLLPAAAEGGPRQITSGEEEEGETAPEEAEAGGGNGEEPGEPERQEEQGAPAAAGSPPIQEAELIEEFEALERESRDRG